MATPNQVTGGNFVDLDGNPLAYGFLLAELSQDSIVNSNTAVGSNVAIKILLDDQGNIQTSPAQTLWPNDALVPANTYYMVTAYTSAGQRVWGPNAQQVLSTPSPFNVSVWTPGIVNF